MHHLGANQRIMLVIAWLKSCLDLCSFSTSSFMAENAANSYLLHQLRSTTKAGSMKLILYWNFSSHMWGRGCLISWRQLAYKREEAYKLLSMMVPDTQGNIRAKWDSHRMSGNQNHRVSTWESGHHQISPDLFSLILWLSAPNFAHS